MPLPAPITSRHNARVKALRAAFSGKPGRPGELVGVEGLKSIMEAFKAGLRFDTLAISSAGGTEATPDRIAQLSPREVLVLSPEVMTSVADTVTPPLIVATVAIPPEDRQGPPTGVFLLLEEIQDPGNVGTLIRSAEAFGVERVYASPGCANLWSPKVLRASAGSVFRQPVRRQAMAQSIGELKARGVRLVGAVARSEGAATSLAANLAPPVGIVIGNEGAGLTTDTLSRMDATVYIPCRTESLNAAVAGSLLLYEVLSRSTHQGAADEAGSASEGSGHGAV